MYAWSSNGDGLQPKSNPLVSKSSDMSQPSSLSSNCAIMSCTYLTVSARGLHFKNNNYQLFAMPGVPSEKK